MIDDLKQQLEKTSAEVERLRAERDQLRAEAQRRNIAEQLATELSKQIDHRAASEAAQALAQKCRVASDGTVIHDGLEAIGAHHVAAKYLEGRGAFLLQTAPIGGRKDAPARTAWDIEKAVNDIGYDEEWQKVDAEGRAAAWKKYHEAIDERQRRAAMKR